ncbi:MAG: ATP-dependent DNA helicase RecQ, partial [Candidatus Neomarinimicrobiota bacterium]
MIRDIEKALKTYWGYDGFLPLQKEAMTSVLGGRDSIVVLSTGGGKSICYQAPAVVLPGLALVVSPLISLMKDQVDALNECGVQAARLDSSMSPEERRAVYSRIQQGTLKLLYLSPERLVSDGFIERLGKTELSFIAVDEAHCVSMWGHDFRPDYRELGLLKKAYPDKAIHAFTATATERVRNDIARQLRLEKPELLVGAFDRPNLVYKVTRRGKIVNQVCAVLDQHQSESGIIYCIRRKDVDKMCVVLTDKGYRVLPYHAGMGDQERKINQEAFIREKVNVIVATVAFGMGIDKSNVRYVIHAGMPKSLEHYQQESGRAGRDGLEADCVLFYSAGDYGTWQRILREMDPEPKEIALGKVQEIFNFCTGVTCRRQAILNYFGQDLGKANCGACDVCLGDL